jgi:uncharacterized protein
MTRDMTIAPDVRQTILDELAHIEEEEGVCILYACESGSRAWGFASRDSDYDVRYIYLRPREWYLAVDLEERSDVLERPISDELDISGWDLRKALQLLRKSNPPLLEWLASPIVYRDSSIGADLRLLSQRAFSPFRCRQHYHSMARGNYRDYLKQELVRRKKYFYVLRPLLAMRWLDGGLGRVPVEFDVLVDRMVEDGVVSRTIDDLLADKRSGRELDDMPRIDALNDFIEAELRRAETASPPRDGERSSPEEINAFFRRCMED